MLASVLLLPPLQVPLVIFDGIFSALYVGNYWFILADINYFADLLTPSPFLHYWSLGVEEQFYLLWAPLVLVTAWLARHVRRSRGPTATSSANRPYLVVLALVVTTSFALSLVVTYVIPPLAFFSLPTRAWQLALGGLVALTVAHWQHLPRRRAAAAGWGGLGLILLACVWYTPTTAFPGIAALLPTLGAALVIIAGCAAPVHGVGRILAVSPMQAVGRMSYSWYLWHWPVLVLAPAWLGHPLGLVGRVTAALFSAVLAWFTLRYLEDPLRFATKIRTSSWRSLALGTVATAASVCVGMGLLKVVPNVDGRGMPEASLTVAEASVPVDADMTSYDEAVRQAFARVQTAVAKSVDLKAVPINLNPPLDGVGAQLAKYSFNGCLVSNYDFAQPECAMGDTASTTTVALFGDSHAAMWIPAFQQIADRQHWRLEALTKAACPPMEVHVDTFYRRLVERLQHCNQWRAEALARLHATRPQLVIISAWRSYGVDETWSGYKAYDPAWVDSLTRLVQELRAIGSQVLVLGPVPSPRTNAAICLSGHLDDAMSCSPSRSAAVNQFGISAEAAATHAGGGQYVDLTDLFCDVDSCPVIVGNILVYIDVMHLTLNYSEALRPVIETLAVRALARGRDPSQSPR